MNLVPIAAGIVIGIGNVTMTFGDSFELSGIALGSIVAIVGYDLARLLAPRQLREPLIQDRACVGGAALSTGTVTTGQGDFPPFRERTCSE